MNIFKKLLRQEFGARRYNEFAEFVEKNIGPELSESKELYDTIYRYCSCMDSEKIIGMQLRLNETLYSAVQVERTYVVSFFLYILAWFYSMMAGFPLVVQLPTIAILSIGFALKTWQYFSSHCRYVDARIINTYRSVLEKILMKRAREARGMR